MQIMLKIPISRWYDLDYLLFVKIFVFRTWNDSGYIFLGIWRQKWDIVVEQTTVIKNPNVSLYHVIKVLIILILFINIVVLERQDING